MCVNKRRLFNPVYDAHNPLSSRYIYASCGHCWQCKQSRSNSFSFRILQETLKPGVIPFFVTLTYRPEYRPLLHYYEKPASIRIGEGSFHDCNLKTISVWNRDHVQRFHKRVRSALEYFYGIKSDAFKYLVTCERGSNDEYIDNRGHKRIAQEAPHYHGIYLLYSSTDIQPVHKLPDDFRKYCIENTLGENLISFFRYLLNRKWFYGWVDDIAFCRDIVASVRYVTKYITKSIGDPVFDVNIDYIYKLYDKEFCDRYDKLIDSYRLYGFACKRPKPIFFEKLLPISMSSISLGSQWFDNLPEEKKLRFLTCKDKVVLPGVHTSSSIPLPSYFYHKFCKTSVKLHEDRWYTKSIIVNNRVEHIAFKTVKKFPCKMTWSNLYGKEFVSRVGVYTSTVWLDLGRKVQRFNIFQQVKNTVNNVKALLSNKDFYLSMFKKYFDFSPEFRPFNVPDQLVIDKAFDTYIDNFFVRALRVRYHPEITDVVDKAFKVLSDFYDICYYTISHLKHTAYELNYANKMPSVARDNPDLFMNHYF